MPGRARQRRVSAWAIVLHGILLMLSLIMLYPFIWMILSSFKTTSEIVAVPPTFFPQQTSMLGYNELNAKLSIARNFFNSVFVSLIATVIASFSAALAGFVFAHYRFRGRNLFFFLLISPMMIPFAVTVIPLFRLFNDLGLRNTYAALIVPAAVTGFGIFLMRQFMAGLPAELFEAGRLDGASDWTLFRRVALPLTASPLGGVAIFTFLTTWNQFWWPLIVISTPDMRTMTQAVAIAATQIAQRLDVLAAGATLAVAPIIIIFALATRQVAESATFSGMKEG